jgi:hypothetical protein
MGFKRAGRFESIRGGGQANALLTLGSGQPLIMQVANNNSFGRIFLLVISGFFCRTAWDDGS